MKVPIDPEEVKHFFKLLGLPNEGDRVGLLERLGGVGTEQTEQLFIRIENNTDSIKEDTDAQLA